MVFFLNCLNHQDMGAPRDPLNDFPSDPFESSDGQPGPGEDRKFVDGPKVQLSELMSLVRHSKLSLIKQALDYLPNKNFDKTLVQVFFLGLFHLCSLLPCVPLTKLYS